MGMESLLPMGISLLGALGKGAGGGGGQQQPAAAPPPIPPLPPTQRMPMPGSLTGGSAMDNLGGGMSPSIFDMLGPMGGGQRRPQDDLLSLLSGGLNGR